MAKAGTMRINIKANSLPDGLTPDSNADTKDSSNANVVKKKAKMGSENAAADQVFSDHVDQEDDDGVSETSDIDVVAAADALRKDKAKSEEGKDTP